MRVGLIGAGYWGPNILRVLREIDGVEVACVADARPGRREFVERKFPGLRTVSNEKDVFSRDDIDAVFIATPAETHRDLAIQALKAGKHVFVEKPLATRVCDAEEMNAAAEAAGRTLAVGHLFLFHPAVAQLKQLLDTGKMGDIYFMSSSRKNLGPPNAAVDVLWDLAPHDISIVLHLMDEVPCSVIARGAAFSSHGLTETAYVNLDFPSGRMAQINVSWLTPNKVRSLEVVCSNRTALFNDMEPVYKLKVFEQGVDNRKNLDPGSSVSLGYGPGGVSMPALPTYEPLRAECEHFFDCIHSSREPINSGRRALATVAVLQAATESIRVARGSRVHVAAAD